MYAELKQIVCQTCGELKSTRYYKTAKNCRDCSLKLWAAIKAKQRAKKRKDNPEKASRADFKYDLKKNYGITVEQFEKMHKEQEGYCACCGRHESEFKRGLHVDHDHITGQVRGLLCTKCNPGIGYFDDKIENLEMAIMYLDKFKKLG